MQVNKTFLRFNSLGVQNISISALQCVVQGVNFIMTAQESDQIGFSGLLGIVLTKYDFFFVVVVVVKTSIQISN